MSRARVMTPRRIQVLNLAAAGRTNAQIGTQLGITSNSVNGHLQAIFAALGAYDRTHAVVLGIRHGYVNANHIHPRPEQAAA